MASHLSTPDSVLTAPSTTRTVISAQVGLTRQERRHGFQLIPNPNLDEEITQVQRDAYALAKAAGKNVPHVGYAGPDPEREERLRNRRKARHSAGERTLVAVVEADSSDVEEGLRLSPIRRALASFDWRGRGA